MKKLSKVLGVLGFAAVVFSSCDKSTNNSASNVAAEDSQEVSITDLKIAYILTDSVIANFDLFKDKSGQITEKGKKFESELGSRARGFEQEVANFEQSAGTMTPNQARAKQEDLMKKERNLVTYRDNLMQELQSDEAQLYSDVIDKIQEFLTEYAEENDLEMILSYTRGGAVWYSKKSLDITEKVTAGLNAKYASSKTEAAK
ncbi:OmpH family outer membrane protein [Belliella kenyensis]|uniref:OmpH family outer membrane protein n=1 Tax=Belliella kenyensis TaxID=1472724 RepID=A0ABV8EJ54_9BACT|nr:OmpH family outer membrane protein [Belliella kenyensis]MCH7400228.1 OmpH family outer membrane protein [Belliella kenyensis]MDN3604755.1 OmpH family outer membrane protein [Belliella kenyensis]